MHRDVILWSGISLASRFGEQPEIDTSSRPMGSYQMAWWLRKHRISTQVIEFTQLMTEQELIDLTTPFITEKTLCIGISRTFLGAATGLSQEQTRALWRLKVKFPKLKFVMGGQYLPSHDKPFPIDKHFVGYGEDTFLKWCQERKSGVAMPNALFNIQEQEHRFIPDDVILPDEALPIELGRGCIFSCKFCSYSLIGKEKGTYLRRHEHLLAEMKYNKDTFGTNKYLFLDDTTNEDYDKVRRFANFEKDLGFPIQWVGYLRADLIWAKKESAEWLQQSGLIGPHFGIESFHPKASQFIGKGWSGKHARDWLPKLHQDLWGSKINMRTSFIVGLPHEPLVDTWNYVKWWREHPSMGNMFFSVLGLTPPPENPKPEDKTSELSYLAAGLGYKFAPRNEDGYWGWESPWGTSKQAQAISHAAHQLTHEHTRPSSWSIMAGVNLGYTVDEVTNTIGRDPRDKDGSRLLALKNRYLTQFAKHFNLTHIVPSTTIVV